VRGDALEGGIEPMGKRPDASSMNQLSLPLPASSQSDKNVGAKSRPDATLVRFVDADTLAVRRDALRRVEASGIFHRAPESKLKA
jgi:hypothetical protein